MLVEHAVDPRAARTLLAHAAPQLSPTTARLMGNSVERISRVVQASSLSAKPGKLALSHASN
jgi:hypothetical protein